MSTIQIHTPEPGWAKRWLKEGTKLVLSCPGAIIIYMLIMPLPGIFSEYGDHIVMPVAISLPISTFLECFLASSAVMMMSREFYRKESFPIPKMTISMFSVLALFSAVMAFLMLILGVVLNVIGAVILAAYNTEIPPQDFDLLRGIMAGHEDFFTYVVVFFFCGHCLPVLAASGMDIDENRITSKMMTHKLQEMVPNIILKVVLGWCVINYLMPYTIFAGPIFVGIVYVASREMIAGPGAKAKAKDEVGSAVPQGA